MNEVNKGVICFRLQDVDKPYLTSEELNAIIKKKFSIKRIVTVRDIFVFCCYTGLSFSDTKELSEDNIQIGIDKNKWIVKNRKKTGVAEFVAKILIWKKVFFFLRMKRFAGNRLRFLRITSILIINPSLEVTHAIRKGLYSIA